MNCRVYMWKIVAFSNRTHSGPSHRDLLRKSRTMQVLGGMSAIARINHTPWPTLARGCIDVSIIEKAAFLKENQDLPPNNLDEGTFDSGIFIF